MSKKIVFYDGECGFCSGIVNFVMDHNPAGDVYFASLQSDLGQETLKEAGLPLEALSTMILKRGDKSFFKSDAALEISKDLGGIWKYFHWFKIVPRFIRDSIYDVVAKFRLKIGGKADNCRMLSPEERKRFIGFPVS